jgi:hypothetical protein
MEKLAADRAVTLLISVAEAMAQLPEGGAPLGDARLIRELADRLLDAGEPFAALVRDALDRVLDDSSPTARSGALALVEMLRELGDDRQREC